MNQYHVVEEYACPSLLLVNKIRFGAHIISSTQNQYHPINFYLLRSMEPLKRVIAKIFLLWLLIYGLILVMVLGNKVDALICFNPQIHLTSLSMPMPKPE